MTSGDGCSTDGCRSAQWHSSFLTKNTLCKCRAMLRHIKSLHSLLNAVLKNRLNVQKLPKASHIPGHQRAGIPAAGASAPQSPMLLLSSQSFSKLPLVLRLSARAWPTRAEGKQAGFTPSPHLVIAHIGANLQSTQHPVDRITGRPLVKITVSLQLLPLMLGKSSNSHFQNLPSKHPTARNSQQCCDM